MLGLIVRVVLYLIPLYITNSTALLFGGKRRLDLGRELMGMPLLGKGKTIEGTLSGLAFGLLSVFLLSTFLSEYTAWLHPDYLLFGTLLCFGAVAGDLMGSFIKRRSGIQRGGRVFLLDQLDFIIGGIAFTYWLATPMPEEAALIVVITLVAHCLSNYIAYRLKMKSVPW